MPVRCCAHFNDHCVCLNCSNCLPGTVWPLIGASKSSGNHSYASLTMTPHCPIRLDGGQAVMYKLPAYSGNRTDQISSRFLKCFKLKQALCCSSNASCWHEPCPSSLQSLLSWGIPPQSHSRLHLQSHFHESLAKSGTVFSFKFLYRTAFLGQQVSLLRYLKTGCL